MNTTKNIIIWILVGFVALFASFTFIQKSYAPTISEQPNLGALRTSGAKELGTFKTYTAIAATSSSATSTEVSIAGAKKISLFLNRPTSAANATSTFSVLVSLDGTNYITYSKLIENTTNTNAQMLTRVASKAVVGTSSAMLSMDLTSDSLIGMKCIGVIAGTGSQSCSVLVEY